MPPTRFVTAACLALVLMSGTAAAPMYRQKGEQYRIYEFPGTGEPIPYRLFVPESWTPDKRLPVLVTLRAGNSINNNHRGNN